ncbi:hypothetical protein FO519_007067 [Halicephalobus sp. NKZ332]|nr:hypothetical protein FO519_007067 [Halicephalobus sp. NKZ332]
MKKLSCSVNALEWFRENKIFLKLQFLGIRQTKASLVFDFLSDPCFETEELKIETINLNINPILQLVEKKLQFPSVKKLHYGTNEQEVHGKLPEILPKLLRAFLALFPSLETLNLKISTEPLFISKTEDNFSPSADQLMNNFETMKKAIRNCEISPTVNIVFQNFIRLWFRIPVHELVAYFEDLTKTFSEKKIEGGTTWRIGEKKENVEISMSVSAKKGTGLRFIS